MLESKRGGESLPSSLGGELLIYRLYSLDYGVTEGIYLTREMAENAMTDLQNTQNTKFYCPNHKYVSDEPGRCPVITRQGTRHNYILIKRDRDYDIEEWELKGAEDIHKYCRPGPTRLATFRAYPQIFEGEQ